MRTRFQIQNFHAIPSFRRFSARTSIVQRVDVVSRIGEREKRRKMNEIRCFLFFERETIQSTRFIVYTVLSFFPIREFRFFSFLFLSPLQNFLIFPVSYFPLRPITFLLLHATFHRFSIRSIPQQYVSVENIFIRMYMYALQVYIYIFIGIHEAQPKWRIESAVFLFVALPRNRSGFQRWL